MKIKFQDFWKRQKKLIFHARSANLSPKILSSMFNIKYTKCCRTSCVWFEVAYREFFPVALIHVGRSPPPENLLYSVKQRPYAFLWPLLEVENQLSWCHYWFMSVPQLIVLTLLHSWPCMYLFVCQRSRSCLLEMTAGGLTLALPARCHIVKTFFTIPFTEGQLIELIHELCRRITNNSIASVCEQMTLQFSHCFVAEREGSRIYLRRG